MASLHNLAGIYTESGPLIQFSSGQLDRNFTVVVPGHGTTKRKPPKPGFLVEWQNFELVHITSVKINFTLFERKLFFFS